MLGNHPQLFGLAETNLFMGDTFEELSRIYRMRRSFQHGLLRSIAELGLGGQDDENVETARQWLQAHAGVSTGELFRDLMVWAAPRAVIDKSPMYAYSEESLQRIHANFPEARYLHLLRHPRPACESIYKLRQEVRQKTEQHRGRSGGRRSGLGRQDGGDLTPEKVWLKPHVRIMEFLAQIPAERKVQLQGELFLEDPAFYLPQIADWLGVDSSQEAVAAMQRPEESPFADYGPKNAKFGNDPGFMESPELRPYSVKPENLDDPLSWESGGVFSDTLKSYAVLLGYG